MLRAAVSILILLNVQSSSSDPWMNIKSLVSIWKGTSSGQPGNETVSRTYEFTLGGKFMHVRNKSTYAPQEKNRKGEVHKTGVFSVTILDERNSYSGNFTSKDS
jgi:hypothetical protein